MTQQVAILPANPKGAAEGPLADAVRALLDSATTALHGDHQMIVNRELLDTVALALDTPQKLTKGVVALPNIDKGALLAQANADIIKGGQLLWKAGNGSKLSVVVTVKMERVGMVIQSTGFSEIKGGKVARTEFYTEAQFGADGSMTLFDAAQEANRIQDEQKAKKPKKAKATKVSESATEEPATQPEGTQPLPVTLGDGSPVTVYLKGKDGESSGETLQGVIVGEPNGKGDYWVRPEGEADSQVFPADQVELRQLPAVAA